MTSLNVRIVIAGAIQVLEYEVFWTRIFNILGVAVNEVLLKTWKARNHRKSLKTSRKKTVEGKAQRIKNKYNKPNKLQVPP